MDRRIYLSSGTGKVRPVYARCLQWSTYMQCVINHSDRWQDDIDQWELSVANSTHRLRYTPDFPKNPQVIGRYMKCNAFTLWIQITSTPNVFIVSKYVCSVEGLGVGRPRLDSW
jgi:hypothetical protein